LERGVTAYLLFDEAFPPILELLGLIVVLTASKKRVGLLSEKSLKFTEFFINNRGRFWIMLDRERTP